MAAILFLLGLCIGSFLNIVALRYDGEHFIFDPKVIGGPKGSDGRSHCPHCGKTLQWFELIPVVSFIIQRAQCRGCHAKIGWRYPAVELLTGALFVAVPWRLSSLSFLFSLTTNYQLPITIFWILAFLILLLISYIDIRLGIIPDELEIALGIAALGIILLESGSIPLNIIGMIAAFVFFELLVLVTRGRGMGMGDVKLALPLGFLLGWPDIALAVMAAFIIGAVVGVTAIALGKNKMGGTLPFGPFLALGAAFVFFAGSEVLRWYFGIMGV